MLASMAELESGGLVPVLIEPPLCGSFCVMRFATKSREEIWFSARLFFDLKVQSDKSITYLWDFVSKILSLENTQINLVFSSLIRIFVP